MSLDLTLKNHEINFNVTNLSQHKVYEFEDFRLDASTKLLYRSSEQLMLTPKAVETLVALVENHGNVISKGELMEKIWAGTAVEESNLAQYLHILRKTLGKTSEGKAYIETLKRRGYRFNSNVRVIEHYDGISPRVERAKDFEKARNGSPIVTDSLLRRVERRGNVLAVAKWIEKETIPERVERKEIVPAVDRVVVRYLVLASSAAAILIALVAFTWFRTPAVAENRAQSFHGGLTLIPLTNAETAEQAAISPDGKYFAYVEYSNDSSRIWLQQVGESSRIETVKHFGGRITGLTFTPDSASVYFLGWRETDSVTPLYRVGALGGVPIKVLSGIDSPVSFSPDGHEIAFVRIVPASGQRELVVATNEGAGERVLLSRSEAEIIQPNPAWSPNGKQIAFGLMQYEKSIGFCSLVAIDLPSESVRPLSDERWDSCNRTAWLGDGSALVFIGTKFNDALTTRRDHVYLLSIASRTARRLTNSGDRHETSSLGVTKANDILALPYSRLSQIWSLDWGADAQTAKQITNGQSDGRGGVESLSDRSIFYLSRVGDGFGIFRTDLQNVRESRVIADDPTMEELRASPDGRFLVFAAKVDGYGHLFRVDTDGTNRRQLSFGGSIQSDSTVSPDGQWIVYASHFTDGDKTRYSLKKIPADGGEPVPLTNEFCRTPHFSNDGKMISCIAGEFIRIISFETGETLKSFKAVGVPVLNSGSRWTPDGQNLVYRVFEKDVVNLWLQPIAGGEPRVLTNFSYGHIYNFSFNPDGSRIYLARGNPVRNAVLIKDFD